MAETENLPRCNCRRHAPTRLGCGRCNAPICPACMVQTPTGMICRACSSINLQPLFQVEPARFAAALGACTLLGVGLGWLLIQLENIIGIFAYFAAIILGGLLAQTALVITSRKRGPEVEAAAGGGTAAGMAAAVFIAGVQTSLLVWGMLVLAAVVAVKRIRYLE